MEVNYLVSPSIKYRRESFGGIVYNVTNKTSRFYNYSAAYIIEQFLSPNSLQNAVSTVQPFFENSDDVLNFCHDLLNSHIIFQCIDGDKNESAGRGYFTNVTEFDKDRLHAPIGVELELTLKCLRHCNYCAYESTPKIDTTGYLTRNDYQVLFNSLEKIGVFYIRFTGGDPLTRDDALDIAEDADALNFGFTIASDLTAFNEQKCDRLSTFKNLVAIQTTLDGPTPDVADKLRGHGNFNHVVRGLDLLYKNQIPIIVGTVLTKLNSRFIYKTAQFLSKWKVQYCVSPLYSAGRGREIDSLIPSDEEIAEAYEQFAKAVDDGLVTPADPAWNKLAGSVESEIRKTLWSSQPWLIRSPDRLLRINPKGKCYTSIHLKEVLGEEVYLGNVTDHEIIDIWNSAPLLNDLRSNHFKSTYYGDVLDIRNLQLKS